MLSKRKFKEDEDEEGAYESPDGGDEDVACVGGGTSGVVEAQTHSRSLRNRADGGEYDEGGEDSAEEIIKKNL